MCQYTSYRCICKEKYLYDLQKGHGELVEGVWVTVKSIQGRALYFETYIPEYGYMTNYQLVRLFGKKIMRVKYALTEEQLWDCFSYDIAVIEKQMLSGNQVKYLSPSKKWYKGWYMFTIDNASSTNLERNVTYSEVPSQHKSFNILKLENGYFAAQPNNRVIFYDKSYTPSELKFPDFNVSTKEYSVECEQKWTAGDDDKFFYDLEERKE